MSESSDLDSQKNSDGRVSSSTGHAPIAVAEVRSRSTYWEDTDQKRNKYARTGTATYIILHRRGTEGSGKGQIIVGSAELFPAQRVGNIVESAMAVKWEADSEVCQAEVCESQSCRKPKAYFSERKAAFTID